MVNNVLPLHEADDLISYKESKISELKVELNDLENEFKSYETIYNELKTKVECKRNALCDAEKSLTILVALRNGEVNLKNIKVYSKISNTVNKPVTKGKKEFNWVQQARMVLNERQEFIKADKIIHDILIKNIGWRGKLEKKYQTQSKMSTHISRISEKLVTTAAAKTLRNKFVLYQDKIGLIEWVNSKGEPKKEFQKKLMFNT